MLAGLLTAPAIGVAVSCWLVRSVALPVYLPDPGRLSGRGCSSRGVAVMPSLPPGAHSIGVVETGVITVMLLWWVVVGLAVGAVARFLVPGRDQMGCLGTILLGVAGSFVGGFLWELIQFHRVELRPIGFIGSVAGAVLVLLLRRLVVAR